MLVSSIPHREPSLHAVRVGSSLSISDLARVARDGTRVDLDPEAVGRMTRSAAVIDDAVTRGQTIYGVTTGIGRLSATPIAPVDMHTLQRNLVLSHAFGVGESLPREVTRAMLLARAQSLALGHSGVRPAVVRMMLEFLNRGVHPVIPAQGSVGSSGDLVPLAHMALPLLGEGRVEYQGRVMPAREALREVGLSPLVLGAKEGLALINGTQAITAIAALVLHDMRELARAADIAGACTFVALRGRASSLDARVFAVRPHPGAAEVAANLRRLLGEFRSPQERVQDAYSLRCMPQVHGASRHALHHATSTLETELHSVIDNPLVFPDEGDVVSAGNFHGQPLALVMDYAKIAIAEFASISERRTAQLLDGALSGLPAFLVASSGLNSGLMISQYTAAALVSENKVLAHPASVDSIPTSANQEDHVSMGNIAARHARQVLENSWWVLVIELLGAAQAVDLSGERLPENGVRAAVEAIREVSPHLGQDRLLLDELTALREVVVSGELRRRVEAVSGPLH